MNISTRFNEKEQKKLEEMKEATGLSASTLIKKALFDNNENHYVNRNMIIDLGAIFTSINKLENAVEYENFETAEENIKIIKEGLMEICQLL